MDLVPNEWGKLLKNQLLSFSAPRIRNLTASPLSFSVETTTEILFSANVTATINSIPAIIITTNGSRCGEGVVTLKALASAGTVNWYNVSSVGTSIHSDTIFVTPSISETTTFYAEAKDNSHISPTRSAVTATINSLPEITETTDSTRCNKGTVTLTATASSGTINWYGSATDDEILASGPSFVTPLINTTTTYYVSATEGECISEPRTAVVATIDNCTSGLNSVADEASIKVYPNPTNGLLDVTIDNSLQDGKVEIYNTVGDILQIRSISNDENRMQLDLSGYPVGIYFIKVTSDNQCFSGKIIKKDN